MNFTSVTKDKKTKTNEHTKTDPKDTGAIHGTEYSGVAQTKRLLFNPNISSTERKGSSWRLVTTCNCLFGAPRTHSFLPAITHIFLGRPGLIALGMFNLQKTLFLVGISATWGPSAFAMSNSG